MKNTVSIPVYLFLFALLSLSWKPVIKEKKSVLTTASRDSLLSGQFNDNLASLYDFLDLGSKGLSKKAFDYACKGYSKLAQKKLIADNAYLTICDFSQSSSKKRLYLIDVANNKLVLTTYVAHGRNSGDEYANRFSNKPSSLQSSLGFYITRGTYYGGHGLSLKVDGVEKGYNDKAMGRNIVIHGADYIEESWLKNNNRMGRSYGCPAIPRKECASIINTIKNGSCIFIYHPSGNYLKSSKILND